MLGSRSVTGVYASQYTYSQYHQVHVEDGGGRYAYTDVSSASSSNMTGKHANSGRAEFQVQRNGYHLQGSFMNYSAVTTPESTMFNNNNELGHRGMEASDSRSHGYTSSPYLTSAKNRPGVGGQASYRITPGQPTPEELSIYELGKRPSGLIHVTNGNQAVEFWDGVGNLPVSAKH